MKNNKINCQQAKKIDLYSYLKKNCFKPKKEIKNEAWFSSPFRVEKTPSFKVNLDKNIWYDFGLGLGGTIIDFVMKFNNCSIKEALTILDNNTFSFHQQPKIIAPVNEQNYSITKVTELTNPNLIKYLMERKINIELAKKYCFQVHYRFKNHKEYYGIGFINDNGGWEIRSSIFKGCLYKKTITTINNSSDTVCLFESFSDFLSYLTINKNMQENENYIILNSTALVKYALEYLNEYETVKCYLDNDNSGIKATEIIKQNCKNQFIDRSYKYTNYKDLNEYLMCHKNSR
ncbi:MAG: toprim domain-containing protein [Lutibacter sp.]|uniref:toprim domain-containing protein n=1 Tax=Lutibacter sp. TaxID=1925666 RepID=UPI00385A24D5